MLLTMKSSRSRMIVPFPRGATCDQTLKPRTQGRDRMKMAKKLNVLAFFRLQPSRSMELAMRCSNTATTVDMAAKLMNRKNRALQRRPCGMWLNMLGSVTKISPGPASGLTP